MRNQTSFEPRQLACRSPDYRWIAAVRSVGRRLQIQFPQIPASLRRGRDLAESGEILTEGWQGCFAATSPLGRDWTPPRGQSQNSVCLLAPGGTSGERIEERGIPNKKAPPLPSPLLHFVEEREKIRLLGGF